MIGLDVAYTLGPWVVLNVCTRRANPEMGMGGGVSAATVVVRLMTWASWRGYDYEPWSNGHPFLAPSRAPETSAKRHSSVNGPSPNVKNGLGVAGPTQLQSVLVAGQVGDCRGDVIGVGQGDRQPKG